ncbi:type 1 glutamine amidotransferase [Rathayibacter toxicus]|uniref:Lipid II isoglutaminyl synthase (glutamine-hydrolyzing) subunit GatD n=1 Tax=Rathayibacter toxicus TaxID=145458 RepID=A0A0C5BHD7_9MICO|nr:hypothetical protein [Rathayibacter toxicus]AJM77645.1 hypothetical protein TI83_06245 [Rathayibacter toxicus]ALS56417.1 hypothetical protein APU90_00235 [Rathayibacter toxicus]KKM44526.1 hypothetical protein VT73_08195 [Rathayibacter toxicus]PPG21765.1 hypothetical protein C5D15_06060 [Rathayibacter toxicus]PPG46727.1 hypothetical protein C5D16_06035 [Rathayibacter toxicus]
MTILRIAVLAPDALDSNGDAANARVLAARAHWSGCDAAVLALRESVDPMTRPDILVVGTGAEQDLPGVLTLLNELGSSLHGWVADGTEIVAVGAGWELLAESFTTASGVVEGIGLFPGRAVSSTSTERVSDDLVVESADGVLIGFENHVRRMEGFSAEQALGRVLYGVGNGNGTEGYRSGALLGTHLHGPVLAKNPILADAILRRVIGHGYQPIDDRIRAADNTAQAARDVIARRLGVGRR